MTNQEERNVFNTIPMVIAAFTAFFILSIMTARTASAEIDPMVEAATIERIKPFGQVYIEGQTPVVAAAVAAPAAVSASAGKDTYTTACSFCHNTGAAGSPKLGDKAAWKSRIAQGESTLFDHAINGFKTMPAKGGNSGLSDDAVKAAVTYMVDGSK